jgi:GntR family transcriptional regulator/MocR family aminotransferase
MSPRHRQVRELPLSIERGRGHGIGRQIEAQLRERISSGVLPMGTALPSTRVLAEDLAVSRGVVARAYRQLAAEG